MSISARADKNLSLWLASPDELLSGDNLNLCKTLLSGGERSRMERFVKERDRREFLAAHALVRNALSFSYPFPPEAWSFTSNAFGKPEIVQKCGLEFNLAHSTRMVACVVSHGFTVGIDVEPYESAHAISEIASDIFSPIELNQFQQLPAHDGLNRALSLWTLKEAYAKARGSGFSLPFKKFSFVFHGEFEIRLELESELVQDPSCWQFCLMDHADHRIAVVTERKEEQCLRVCEAKTFLAEPTWLEPVIRWFPAAPPPQSS
jgi:4'-phosphopantetheinyl transferase